MRFLKWMFWSVLVLVGIPVSSFVLINLIYLLFFTEADSPRLLQSAVYNTVSFFFIILPLSWKLRQMKRELAPSDEAEKKYSAVTLEDSLKN